MRALLPTLAAESRSRRVCGRAASHGASGARSSSSGRWPAASRRARCRCARRAVGTGSGSRRASAAVPRDRGLVGTLPRRDAGGAQPRVSAQVHSTLNYSRKLAALGRLMAGVAHEVKNPLNAMTIHLELLKQKLAAHRESDRRSPAPAAGPAAVRWISRSTSTSSATRSSGSIRSSSAS